MCSEMDHCLEKWRTQSSVFQKGTWRSQFALTRLSQPGSVASTNTVGFILTATHLIRHIVNNKALGCMQQLLSGLLFTMCLIRWLIDAPCDSEAARKPRPSRRAATSIFNAILDCRFYYSLCYFPVLPASPMFLCIYIYISV